MDCLKCSLPLGSLGRYGLHPECFFSWFNVSGDIEFRNLARKAATSNNTIDRDPNNTSFFHGKFKKYAATLGGTPYILKMKEIEVPELPQVEYLCNQIGELLEIPIAEFFIIKFEGEIVFVTKNFIHPFTPTDLQHIYHFISNKEYSCEELFRIVKEHTKRPYDVNVLINVILFDALIGNHDRHGRNLALLVKSGQIVLSPIYDNVSYLSLEKGNMLRADFNPTGKIATKLTKEPTMRDYVKELKRLGYHQEIKLFFERINLEKINNLIEKSFCGLLMKDAMKKLIEKRFGEIRNEL